jgi:hypothetical protein
MNPYCATRLVEVIVPYRWLAASTWPKWLSGSGGLIHTNNRMRKLAQALGYIFDFPDQVGWELAEHHGAMHRSTKQIQTALAAESARIRSVAMPMTPSYARRSRHLHNSNWQA